MRWRGERARGEEEKVLSGGVGVREREREAMASGQEGRAVGPACFQWPLSYIGSPPFCRILPRLAAPAYAFLPRVLRLRAAMEVE